MAFIASEREWIEKEKLEIDSKRSLSSMFIPDIKNLVNKMQATPSFIPP
jgi:hypothetical protein